MAPLLLAFVLNADDLKEPDRTPAIYRCPAAEAEGRRLPELVISDGFSFLCVDPKPGPKARSIAAGHVTFVSPASIDKAANRRWRDAMQVTINRGLNLDEPVPRLHTFGLLIELTERQPIKE